MNIKLNKVLIYIFITLFLGGCGVKAKSRPPSGLMIIDIDRNDIIAAPEIQCNDEKFRVKSLDYSSILIKNPIAINEYREDSNSSFFRYSNTKDNHAKWMNKLREHVREMESRINGGKNGNMFDIRNIPIGFSYKMELDKPRRKAKCCDGN